MDPILIANRIETVNYWTGLVLNSLLVFLIIKVRRGEAAYKYLQLAFVLNDLGYATISYALGDKMITKGHTFAMFLTSPHGNSLHLICLFAASFSLIIVIVAFNFLYRYWAVVNPQRIKLFSTIWFPICLVLFAAAEFAVWYGSCFFLYTATDEGRAYLVPEFLQKYGLDAMTHEMVMADYWRDGHYNTRTLIGISVFMTIVVAGVVFMVFCMIGILRYLAQAQALSARTKKLQYQLFRTLTVQTIVPVFFLHSTCGITIVLPLLGVDLSMFCDWISVSCSCFPPFDAIATILLMRDYRMTVRDLLMCRVPRTITSMTVSVSKVSPVSIGHGEGERGKQTRESRTSSTC